MNILLTGHKGYIGTIMAQFLVEQGHTITGLDTGYYEAEPLYSIPMPHVRSIQKDIRDVTPHDVRGHDAVIHLAELSNDPIGQNNPELTIQINHHGTIKLIDACRHAGVPRFLYSSSCSVYGASDNMSDETSSTHPLTAYAKSKVMNEQYLLSLHDSSFSVTIMRNATVYGPSPRMRFDLAVNNLAGLAWTTRRIVMDSDGSPWRPFVHVKDVCKAFSCVLQAPEDIVHKQVFNVGNTTSNYQIKDIAHIIGEVFGISDISLNPNGADKRNYRVNFDKIHTILPSFSCSHDVRSGAQDLKDIFTKIKLTPEMFTSRAYTRLAMIKWLKESHQLTEDLYWKEREGAAS